MGGTPIEAVGRVIPPLHFFTLWGSWWHINSWQLINNTRPTCLRSCNVVFSSLTLQQNGWVDPDAVENGELGRSRDGCIRWGPRAQGEAAVLGIFRHLHPHWFEWAEWRIFSTETYSTRTWKVDSISVRTRYRWNLRFIGFPKIQWNSRSMFGVCAKFAKM